jgi:hypothetical protein
VRRLAAFPDHGGRPEGGGATGRLVGLLSEGLKTKVGADGARQVAQRACYRADVRQPSARVHALTWYSEGVDPRPWTATLPPARTWQTRRPASAQGGVLAPRSRQRPAARSCGKGCFPERSSRQSQATPSAAGGRAVAACIPLSPVSRRIKTICMGSSLKRVLPERRRLEVRQLQLSVRQRARSPRREQ